ncbi:hypothetical protein BP6252_05031 [Coleophoma cylindrospora]|uniref:SWI-SNF chromatin-remodeling complex protein n=1 Tax=Coleophoma cylindrospora TaxID=1849047 RepID=A0A3D8RSN4_9HELO|nr:hypothetical protein BP6252_05031 [Coleophoma cylindrospora]
MARPFRNEFETDQSPMSPVSGSGTPTSYRANVNRQKTKKWVDAKTVDYGGDDWGDDDDYYNPPPPPISKLAGPRQQAQAIMSPVGNSDKKGYGDLSQTPDFRGRSNSFDADDEKRNFSSSTMPQQQIPAVRSSQLAPIAAEKSSRAASGPPALHISTQQPPMNRLQTATQIVSPQSESPHPPIPVSTDSSSKSVVSPISDSRNSSVDFQTRRDFSPTAVPPPLAPRASAAPQSATDSPSTKFPPRKSSISHHVAPNIAGATRARQESPGPWTSGRSESPGGASAKSKSSAASAGKALPFIRPADIYKRMEEERERERQSMESGRPSLDSVLGAPKASERSESPGRTHIRERASSDSLGGRRSGSLDYDEGYDSGRRLMPMLAPVQERKSEYGFEGYEAPQESSKPSTGALELPAAEGNLIASPRVPSTSPKLPDLNRMSGFGLDLFSQSQSNDSMDPADQERSPNSAATRLSDSTITEDPELRTQPSLGFRSVVNQAFDRSDQSTDSSVPATPASLNGTVVKRTDSESTGTAGISPIMSRGLSAANLDNRNRETSTLEVVNEAPPVEEKNEEEENDSQVPPTFKPGHRRDLSTPSPGNSPARTPDISSYDSVPQAEQALLSRAPDSVAQAPLPIVNEPTDLSRPAADREQSFRPQLPGGWTSFATTNTGNVTPEPEPTQAAAPEISPIPGNSEKVNEDITPTTEKHPLPQPGGPSIVPSVEADDVVQEPQSPVAGSSHTYESMPTPDPAMAPSGSVYSATALDPRLLPKQQSLSPEVPLQPTAPDRAITADSGAVSMPPPEDTLPQIIADDTSGYTPNPTISLKQISPHEIGNDEALQPPSRPQVLPTLSTDAQPQDEESDKLRKEIIKSLSPRTSDAHNYHESGDHLQTPTSAVEARESTYLPDSIYDNYWGDEGEEETAQLSRPATSHSGPEKHNLLKPLSSKGGDSIMDDTSIPPTPPLNTRRSQLIEPESQPGLSHRFSWERSRENVTRPVEDASHESESAFEPAGIREPAIGEMERNSVRAPESEAQAIAQDESGADGSLLNRPEPPEEHSGMDLTPVVGGTVVAGAGIAAAAHALHPLRSSPQPQPSRRLSLAEEKDTGVSSYPVSPTLPGDNHPSKSPQPFGNDGTDQPMAPYTATPTMTATGASVLHGQPSSPTTKLLAFKEILAIQDSHQRINAFDDHRHRFAAMDSGLSEWLSSLQAENPAYSDESSLWGPSIAGNANPSRSRFRRGSTAASPLQPPQPYYQQYLNASSPTTPTTPTSKPGSNIPTGSQQGFTSGGSKLTSQQVQAKGKEFLHTAGIFSGKAGKGAAKAGKGLLAKGKSRFRGNGVGDKTEASVKPKNERRSSWGLPLALSRSVNRPDSSSREPKEAPFEPRPDLPTTSDAANKSVGPINAELSNLGRDTSQKAPQLPALTILSGGSGGPESTSHISEINRPVSQELQDDLAAPVPISKDQPSWDPYNTAPIHEEDGFDLTTKSAHLAPVAVQEDSARSNSNSSDAHFYDANEELSPDEDWVMVHREPTPQDTTKTKPISILHRTRGSFDVTKSSPFAPVSPVRAQFGRPDSAIQSQAVLKKDDPPAQIPVAVSGVSPESIPSPVNNHVEHDEVIPRDPNFKGLPPIRRTSAFGFGFGSRQAKQRFPIDDDDEDASPQVSRGQSVVATETADSARLSTSATKTAVNPYEETAGQIPGQNSLSMMRPETTHASSSAYGQQATLEQRTPLSTETAPRNADFVPVNQQIPEKLHAPGIKQDPRLPPSAHQGTRISQEARRSQETRRSLEARRSQEAWRPNAVLPPSNLQQYVDPQPVRPDSHIHPQRSASLPRATQNQQQKGFDQPPSSAYRYPQLFQAGGQADPGIAQDSSDMPSGYYQEPINRDEAFLPRQQTSEYQLPGVGPPTEEPRVTSSRRNSFFNNLSGKLSRNASRDRAGSMSRDVDGRRLESRGNDLDPNAGFEDVQAKHHRRRSSLFGNLNRASTSGSGPPQSRESVAVQASGSRTDLLNMNKEPSKLSMTERKRSFFGSSTSSQSSNPNPKPNKLSRALTSSMPEEGTGKKKRFSTLSNIFGGRDRRSTKPAASRGMRDEGANSTALSPTTTSHQHGQDIQGSKNQASAEPSQNPVEKFPGQHKPVPEPAQPRAPVQSQSHQRNVLAKEPSLRGSSKPRQDSRSRRPSASGFFGSIMGRKSQQEDRSIVDSSVSTPMSPQPTLPNMNSPPQVAQQPQPQQQHRNIPWQDTASPSYPQQSDRGRRTSREPEPVYDTVPIPGGYSLVHGAEAHQSAQDDPRYIHQGPNDNHVMPQQNYDVGTQEPQSQSYHNRQSGAQIAQYDGAQDFRDQQHQLNGFSSLETYEDYQRRQAPRRLSREDILARSPAREPVGQQRPYQISLPGEEEEIGHRKQLSDNNLMRSLSSELQKISTSGPALRDGRISELQQPILRHPESPAGYPLPVDTTFSPVNPSAQDFPPPPPPKWEQYHSPSNQDLARSNTGKTDGSEVSQVSAEATRSLVPQKKDERGDAPSPSITPERGESPQPALRSTILAAPARAEEDLYDASPKFKNGDLGYEGKEVASNMPRGRAEDEKIFLSGENIPVEREHEGAMMSATSYPGQEWSPYPHGTGLEEWE